MPYYMIIVLSPKVVYLNENNEIVVKKRAHLKKGGTSSDSLADSGSNGEKANDNSTNVQLSTVNGNPYSINSNALQQIEDSNRDVRTRQRTYSVQSEAESVRSYMEPNLPQRWRNSVNSAGGETTTAFYFEKLNGGIVKGQDLTLLTEVSLRTFILIELERMRRESVICSRPHLIDDGVGNSIQATCIVEKEDVDLVVGRFAYCGVGNQVGSISVVALEASKFAKPQKNTKLTQNNENLTTGNGVLTQQSLQSLFLVSPTTSAEQNQNLQNNPNIHGITESSNGLPPDLEQNQDAGYEVLDDWEGQVSPADDAEKKMFLDVASQLRVEQVIEQIQNSALLNFDYLALLLVASTIAGIGLATNNTVAIVASMLVSPIMGPVLALTFGSIVNKWSLMALGLQNELLSLFICMVIGFIIGMIAIAVGTDGLWPTNEMSSRGLPEGLLIGLSIAIPSGMGVALSVLGNNTSSLVGVAISASLLPPAVNAGLCFAYAAFGFSSDADAVSDNEEFSDSQSYLNMGGISLALTIVNIGAIYIAGWLMFRLKEVAPLQDKAAFWQRDTQVFRKLHNSEQKAVEGGMTDLEAQVHLLQEVGKDKKLRQQLVQAMQEDTEGMSLSLVPGIPLSTMLSATSTIGKHSIKPFQNSNIAAGRSSPGTPVTVTKTKETSTKSQGNKTVKASISPSKPSPTAENRPNLLSLFREVSDEGKAE